MSSPEVVVFRSPNRRQCDEFRLTLASAGIESLPSFDGDDWSLRVHERDEASALRELAAYTHEQAGESNAPSPPVPTFGGSTLGVIGFVVVLVSMDMLSHSFAYGIQWHSIGGMNAGNVANGAIYQTLTALTLHADLQHLASNLCFGGLFGYMAGRVLGGGIAWLIIILSGALGNFVNAWVRAENHVSIGSSTAVFAALGILVAHALRPRSPERESLFRRWSPLVAGLLMLALTGNGGERTDVVAHVAGFFAGVGIGWVGCRLSEDWLRREWIQWVAGAAALLVLTVAWAIAIE